MLLLFDLDGTLTDSRPGILRCFAHALDAVGSGTVEPTPAVCVGPPLTRAFETLLGTTDAGVIERAIGAYRDRYEQIGILENALFPGVAEALAGMRRQGHQLRVVTAKPQPYATRIVEHFGIAAFFDAVHGPSFEERSNDKTDLVGLALREAGSRDAVMIGDRANDVRAARANGIRSIAAHWGYAADGELADADYSAGSMDEVVRLLGTLTAQP